jgi:hypothetical protein
MDKAEPLCDLRFVKAEYQLAKAADPSPQFEVSFRPLGGGPMTFVVAEKNGEKFAAELDVLAAIIRARVIRAGIDDENP